MRKTALIVDDKANNLIVEKDLLQVAGFEVFEADNYTYLCERNQPSYQVDFQYVETVKFNRG